MKSIKIQPTFASSGNDKINVSMIFFNSGRIFTIFIILAILKDLIIVVAKPISTWNKYFKAIPTKADTTIRKSNTFQPS